MDDFDAYIVHASEDVGLAEEIADGLRNRGLVVWCNSFTVGRGLREEMEKGLKSSTFGVVLVTPNLFTKKWAVEELDALFALRQHGEWTILPVWSGVTADEVTAASPMIASRFALTYSGDAGPVVEGLARTIIEEGAHLSPARKLRMQVSTGLEWKTKANFLPESLRYYDDHEEEFLGTGLSHHPDDRPPGMVGTPTTLQSLLTRATLYDGKVVSTMGHQGSETHQVLERVGDLGNVWDGAETSLVSYVFQMRSVDFGPRDNAYIQCLGPHREGELYDGPWGPEDWICWVSGVVVAHGNVRLTTGEFGRAIYIAARAIYFLPRVEAPEEQSDS